MLIVSCKALITPNYDDKPKKRSSITNTQKNNINTKLIKKLKKKIKTL